MTTPRPRRPVRPERSAVFPRQSHAKRLSTSRPALARVQRRLGVFRCGGREIGATAASPIDMASLPQPSAPARRSSLVQQLPRCPPTPHARYCPGRDHAGHHRHRDCRCAKRAFVDADLAAWPARAACRRCRDTPRPARRTSRGCVDRSGSKAACVLSPIVETVRGVVDVDTVASWPACSGAFGTLDYAGLRRAHGSRGADGRTGTRRAAWRLPRAHRIADVGCSLGLSPAARQLDDDVGWWCSEVGELAEPSAAPRRQAIRKSATRSRASTSTRSSRRRQHPRAARGDRGGSRALDRPVAIEWVVLPEASC